MLIEIIYFVPEVSCWMVTGERQAARIRSLYLRTILKQDIAFFDKETNTGEVVGRMSGDTVLIQDAMGEKVLQILGIWWLTLRLYPMSIDPFFFSGWEIHTADVNIPWRVYNSICQRLAFDISYVVINSSHCDLWWSHGYIHLENGVTRTGCVC